MGVHPQYRVVELYAPDDSLLPRYVESCRVDREPSWRSIWRHREELTNKTAEWFRQLAESNTEPVERVFLGRAGLRADCSRAVCKYRIEQIARAAGTFPSYPSFLEMDPPRNVGQKGVPVYADGVVYPSRAAAARAAGISRRAGWDRMQHAGWNWL